METLIDVAKYGFSGTDEFSDRPSIFLLGDHIDWLLEAGDRLVDLGCGVGNLVNWLQERDKWAEGVTYQAREVWEGERIHGFRHTVHPILHHADLHKLPFPSNYFDGMICWDALEHTVAPLVVLSEARRVVRPGGRGLVFIPGENWWACKYHVLCPTLKQMIHLGKLAGWDFAVAYDYSDLPEHGQPHMGAYRMVAR